jgi:hypothetical protein
MGTSGWPATHCTVAKGDQGPDNKCTAAGNWTWFQAQSAVLPPCCCAMAAAVALYCISQE